VVVALAVPQFCKARKVHSCIHTERDSHDIKKTRPEVLSSPSNASGRLLGPAY